MSKSNGTPQRTWQEIAAEASREQNIDRLAALIDELITALDAQRQKPTKDQRERRCLGHAHSWQSITADRDAHHSRARQRALKYFRTTLSAQE